MSKCNRLWSRDERTYLNDQIQNTVECGHINTGPDWCDSTKTPKSEIWCGGRDLVKQQRQHSDIDGLTYVHSTTNSAAHKMR